MAAKFILALMIHLMLSLQAWGGHRLNSTEQQVLTNWLAHHPEYRRAIDEDCDCAAAIQQLRAGSGGIWKPVRDYHPYTVTGDFNGDGEEDFAVVLINRRKKENRFSLVVFNGPFNSEPASPAFVQSGMDLKYRGLFYGPPRPRPFRLLLGPFESDSGALLLPKGRSYRWDNTNEE